MKATIPFLKTISVLIAIAATLQGAEKSLFDFSQKTDTGRLSSEDTAFKTSQNEFGPALRYENGLKSPWPSIYLPAEKPWDLSAFSEISFSIKNLEKEPVTVYCKVECQPPEDKKDLKPMSQTFTILVEGERSDTLHIPLIPLATAGDLKASDFFGMRGLPFFGAEGMYVEKITRIVIFVYKPSRVHRFEVGNISAKGTAISSSLPEKPFPFIDRFGQFKHKDWPGKVKDVSDLTKNRAAENADLAANPAPNVWNEYGGHKDGPKLKATGFFRTEKFQGKWHFVDPAGNLFFSHGVNCVTYQDQAGLAGRDKWLEGLPPDDAAHADFFADPEWVSPTTYYGTRKTRTFNYHKYNVSQKYGSDWKKSFPETTRKRLTSWGLNTIGNWSSPDIYRGGKVPFTATTYAVGSAIESRSAYSGRFPDPFDPSFLERTKERIAREIGPVAKDPWCLGVFVDNERPWGDETSMALGVLSSPETQAAKKAFAEQLKGKYKSVDELNQVWGTSHSSWESLLASTNIPPASKARTDLTNFYTLLADKYFLTIKNILKEVAPNLLYLGCRFSTTNPIATAASGRHCDVVSFNIYTRTPVFQNRMMADAGDKPLIVGEFHLGALDRGLFHPGLVPVKDQNERAAVYKGYVRDTLLHTNLVGCHWFQYMDEPTIGRVFDGENYQIGFVDTADTPYPELVAAAREMGASLYRIRLGGK